MMVLKDKAYELIKDSILFCELEQGQIINEKQIMEEHNLGRTPVREAIICLSGEKLLKVLPRRGVVVSDINMMEIGKLFEIRKVLEVHYSKRVVKIIGEKEIDELTVFLKKNEEATKRGDIKEIVSSVKAFHLKIFSFLDDSFLLEVLETLYERLSRILFYVNIKTPGAYKSTYAEHKELIKLLQEGDEKKIASYISRHIDGVKEQVFSCMMES